MRRGVAGVRLCDRAGCAYRWPCEVHGTRTVGDFLYLNAHESALQTVNCARDHEGEYWVSDAIACRRCGYLLCGCDGARFLLPPGWVRDQEHYVNDGVNLAVVEMFGGQWQVRATGSPWPGDWRFPPRNTLREAIAFADELARKWMPLRSEEP